MNCGELRTVSSGSSTQDQWLVEKTLGGRSNCGAVLDS